MEEKFIQEQKEILARLKKINFNDETTINCLNFINKKKLIDFDSQHKIYDISQYYSIDNIKEKLENQLFTDMKRLISSHEDLIKKLNKIIMNEAIIQNEYNTIIDSIKGNESQIKELLDYYGDFLKENKGFLIRNEILKTFLSKILISKEDKENLSKTETFDEEFFDLIKKMIVIQENIDIINKNSGSFSKTLLMSIQEHHSLIDELINEKIVICLKNIFRTKGVLSLNDFNRVWFLIDYLKQKEHYLKFVVNEYTQMKKKLVEEQLKGKYLKIAHCSYDEIFKNLNEDFIYYFLKEFLLINYLFNNSSQSTISPLSSSTSLSTEAKTKIHPNEIYEYINYEEGNSIRDQVKLSNLVKKQTTSISSEDLNIYILNLNTILYVFEDLFFQQTQRKETFEEVYKITLLSHYYTEQIEKIFKENHLEGVLVKLSIIIANYKKNYSMLFKKMQNDTIRSLQKLKSNLINYLNDSQILITNESVINQSITTLINDYIKMFSLYKQFTIDTEEKDKEMINPLQHDTYLFLINFFNSDQIKKETNLEVLFKVINLLYALVHNLKEYDCFNMKKNEDLIEELIDISVAIIIKNVLTITKFEDSLLKSISHDQTTALIEYVLEKIQLSIISLHYISDYSLKENIKDRVKRQIVKVYKEIILKDSVNLSFISEEELKNYLDIL